MCTSGNGSHVKGDDYGLRPAKSTAERCSVAGCPNAFWVSGVTIKGGDRTVQLCITHLRTRDQLCWVSDGPDKPKRLADGYNLQPDSEMSEVAVTPAK
ncbi:MAG: hypothetical protein PHR51_01275 [Patescibacteria group bacterium]|nr:hypothetical protein [Patescibacteria group bacterium]